MDKRESYWHAYHAPRLTFLMTDKQHLDRLATIKKTKPANEIPIRLELIKKVKGRLPEELYEAQKACCEARKAYYEMRDDYDGKEWDDYYKMRDNLDKVLDDYGKAADAYCKAHFTYKDEIEALHKKECGCEYWNGKEIVFPESEANNESSSDI